MSGFKEKLKEKIRKIGGYLKKKEVFSWAREYKDQNNQMVKNPVSTSLEEKVYRRIDFDGSKTHIDIPFGYTSIGWGAFNGCSGLQSITIPNSVTSIGSHAFSGCSGLQSITIPDSVISIGDYAFSGCRSIQSITIPDSVTSIGSHAFSGCSGLQSITIPNSVTSIGDWAFYVCSSLQSITIPDSVTSIGDNAFSRCSGLQSITIPNSVTSIGDNAFGGCSSLETITIPDSVTSIGSHAFSGCSSLKEFNVSPSNKMYKTTEDKRCLLDKDGKLIAFAPAGLESYVVPGSVTSIGASAFSGCSGLQSITIPDSVTSIGDYAFFNCSGLKSITIPDSVTSIGDEAFSGCSGLQSITIPDSVTSIGDFAFYGCSDLQSITIPEGVTSIGDNAFEYCSSLQSITIPEGVTSIGDEAFRNCSSLQSITIPDSVTSIRRDAFARCSNLNIFNFVSHGKIYGLRKAMMSDLFAVVSQKEKYLKYLSKSIPQRAVDDLIEKRKIDDIEDLSAFHTLINKFGDTEKSDSNIYDLVSFGFNLGIFSNEKIQYRGQNGKVTEMKVRELAYNVLQKVLSTGIDINDIHSHFHSMQVTEFNKEFLLFLNKKNTLEELIEEERVNSGFITRVYSWFNERKHMDISTAEYVDMTEKNRYQVQVYETTESGIDKLRWREPNVENLKKEFVSKKFFNVTPENKHIAEQMSRFSSYEQKHFDKAIEIDRERKEKGTPDHILEREVKQSIEEAWKEYFEEVEKTKNEILDVAQDTLKTQTETAGKIFTYEMLKKSDEANFCMGFLTSCCANLYGAGAGAQRAMIVSPDMQPLVIRDNRGDIVCFGIVYVNREEGYAVVNDFELNKKYQNASSEVTEKIYKKAIQGVKEFVKEYDKEESEKARKDSGYVAKPIRIVTCGVSPNWSKGGLNQYIEREKSHHTLKAPNFNEYKYSGSGSWSGDWHGSQYVIYEREGEKRNEK